jgi:hypothetical protein
MSPAPPASSFRDALATLGAVYVAMTAAGLVKHVILLQNPRYDALHLDLASILRAWQPIDIAVALLFVALLAVYAIATGPGRRTGSFVLVMCAAAWSLALFVFGLFAAVLVSSELSHTISTVLLAGRNLAPPGLAGGFGLLLRLFEIPLLALLAVMIRAVLAARRPG